MDILGGRPWSRCGAATCHRHMVKMGVGVDIGRFWGAYTALYEPDN